MKPVSMVKTMVKWAFHTIGMDIVRWKNNPEITLLGLNNSHFRTVIDVGANTGQFASRISGFFPNANIYCFEPLPDPFAVLETWSKKTNGRVTPFNMAIGDKEGEVEMFLHEDHSPSSSMLTTTKLTEEYYPFTKSQRRIRVKQSKLDVALVDARIELVPKTLIKMDVQGYEDRVLAGGANTFAEASACVLEVCLDRLYEDQATFKELLMLLDSYRYRYVGNLEQSYADDGHVIYIDAVFLKKPE